MTIPRVGIDRAELANSILADKLLHDACEGLSKAGCLILENLFPQEMIERLCANFLDTFGSMSADAMLDKAKAKGASRFLKVGHRRFEIALPLRAPYLDPGFFAHPVLWAVLSHFLDKDIKLSGFTSVVSFPGAAAQGAHRDNAHLFDTKTGAAFLPPHAITTSIPLIDVDLECGPTGVWPGSHRWPSERSPGSEPPVMATMRAGDCLLTDYRTIHEGLPNKGQLIRPILYLVYARPWFFDEANHFRRDPLDVSVADYEALPQQLQTLLSRARRAHF